MVGAIAGIGASLVGSAISGSGAQSAASTQSAASDAAIAEQKRQFDLNRSDLAPWRDSGSAALSKLDMLLGVNPTSSSSTAGSSIPAPTTPWTTPLPTLDQINKTGSPDYENLLKGLGYTGAFGGGTAQQWAQSNFGSADPTALVKAYNDKVASAQSAPAATADPEAGSLLKNFTLQDFQEDPGYNFQMQQGQTALDRAAAARGSYLSGGALKAADRYNQDYASTAYNTAYDRYNTDRTTKYNFLSGLAGTGQAATNTGVSAGTTSANNISNLLTQQGNVNAAGTVAQSNLLSQDLTGLGTAALKNTGSINSFFANNF